MVEHFLLENDYFWLEIDHFLFEIDHFWIKIDQPGDEYFDFWNSNTKLSIYFGPSKILVKNDHF